jgi:hypothetical protein
VEDPIVNALGSVNWGQLLFGSGLNSAGFRATGAGPGASANTVASGGGFFSGIWDFITSIFHSGGVVGSGSAPSRRVPSFVFHGAPRLHTGGFIGPGEVPIIARAGETVLTPQQMAQLGPAGGGEVNVQVINQTSARADATATTQRGPDGRMMIKLILTEVAKDIRSNGITAKAISDTYKATPGPGVNR